MQEWDAGAKLADLVRRLGVTEQTLYRWKKKYGGLQVNEAKRLKALEEENRQLKRLVADQALNLQIVKDHALRRMCVEIYNDAAAEIQSESGNRLLPMPVLPALQQYLDAIGDSPPPEPGASVAEQRAQIHAMLAIGLASVRGAQSSYNADAANLKRLLGQIRHALRGKPPG